MARIGMTGWTATVFAWALAFAGVLAGCSREEPQAAPAAKDTRPESYMRDEAFLGKVREQQSQRDVTMKAHMKVRREYEAALKADPKGERPETKALRQRLDELEEQYQQLRQDTLRTVRERIAPKRGAAAAETK